jgi:TATA-box binding protein (TBP) (component of TFIID and TFIIIB)
MINYINVDDYNMDKIPENVSISTMSIGCNLGTLFNVENIYNNLRLDSDNIIAIKSGKGVKCLDEYLHKFKSTNKNSERNFYNQITLIIKVRNDIFINILLFKNGSLHLSGCKSLIDVNIIINKLIMRLSEKDGEITYVENADNFRLNKFKIDFINSNFGVNYLINKVSLSRILTEKKILCRLSEKHACVNIKHKINADIYVSIFLFQTGNIIITGAKTPEHIKKAYIFMVKTLNKYKTLILKMDIKNILTAEEYEEIFI